MKLKKLETILIATQLINEIKFENFETFFSPTRGPWVPLQQFIRLHQYLTKLHVELVEWWGHQSQVFQGLLKALTQEEQGRSSFFVDGSAFHSPNPSRSRRSKEDQLLYLSFKEDPPLDLASILPKTSCYMSGRPHIRKAHRRWITKDVSLRLKREVGPKELKLKNRREGEGKRAHNLTEEHLEMCAQVVLRTASLAQDHFAALIFISLYLFYLFYVCFTFNGWM